MANTSAPFGFRPIRNQYNAAPTWQVSWYSIADDNSSSFGQGDVVKLLTTGYIDKAAYNDTLFLGVFQGCEYYDTQQQKWIYTNQWAAPSTALAPVRAQVIDDPNVVFEVQSGNGGPVTIAAIGDNITFGGGSSSPNAYTGISVEYADYATINTTATLPFRVVGLGQKIGNDNTSIYNTIEVIVNASNFKTTTGLA